MSYQALARKWRPHRFSELVGQDHVVRALRHALERQSLHHALLFSGTRGVGKTTLARIIAKCLNCERGITAEPCPQDEQCSCCAAIDQGRFVDLIEVDAASRTGVDDTRELMDNVQYAPAQGRCKVYLIDEVHMLSKHAFNALLKTLEEPPDHVQFLLATTDPQKIPITILSRCLQFPLKRLPVSEIAGQLRDIVTREEVEADDAALEQLARGADGSMRDGLSLLDQAMAFGAGALHAETVNDMLGTISQAVLYDILEAVSRGDAAALMAAIAQLDERAPDYASVLDTLAGLLHRLAVAQLVPAAQAQGVGQLQALAQQLAPQDVQLYYDIALGGRRDLDWAPDPRSGVEMTCLRMLAFRPGQTGEPPQRAKSQQQSAAQTPPVEQPSAAATQPGTEQSAGQPVDDQQAIPRPSPQPADDTTDWGALLPRLGLGGMTAELARHCSCRALSPTRVELELPGNLRHLLTDKAEKQLRAALQTALGGQPSVKIDASGTTVDSPAKRQAGREQRRQEDARQAIANDPNVQALCSKLGAKVREDSIRPEDGGNAA